MSLPVTARTTEFLEAVLAGLSRSPRTLPCRFFYDYEGSRLFERICDLPEYYLTRTEDALLHDRVDELADLLSHPVDLVEFGSGSSRKTRRILEALLDRQDAVRYLPIDISEEMLTQTARTLSREYPGLAVEPVVAEYFTAMDQVRELRGRPTLVLFLGSNLGNFARGEAAVFLRALRRMLQPEDRVLLGLDLRKDPAILEAAYNDAAGVTAAFNLNLLRRINAELDGNFELSQFRHRAFFNPVEGRIEMHLISECFQSVRIAGHEFCFQPGETIHTENSCKYTRGQITAMACEAGLTVVRTWTDARDWFSLNLLAPGESF